MGHISNYKNEHLISDVIQKVLKESNLERPYVEHRISRIWNELMGPLSRYILKTEFYDDVLYVTVSSPLVKQELNLLQDEILEKLHQQMDVVYLKKIVIR